MEIACGLGLVEDLPIKVPVPVEKIEGNYVGRDSSDNDVAGCTIFRAMIGR